MQKYKYTFYKIAEMRNILTWKGAAFFKMIWSTGLKSSLGIDTAKFSCILCSDFEQIWKMIKRN